MFLRVLLVVSAVLFGATEARAHAVFLGSEPADGAALLESPATGILHFNEPVTPIAVRLLDSSGEAVKGTGTASTTNNDVHLTLPAGLAPGFYLLSFRVISLDSHPVAAS